MAETIGSVDGNRLVLYDGHGQQRELDLNHVSSIAVKNTRHQVAGTIFMAVGAIALLGFLWVLVHDSAGKWLQLLFGLILSTIGYLLFVGRRVLTIQTSGGEVRSRSVPAWKETMVEDLAQAIRRQMFGGRNA